MPTGGTAYITLSRQTFVIWVGFLGKVDLQICSGRFHSIREQIGHGCDLAVCAAPAFVTKVDGASHVYQSVTETRTNGIKLGHCTLLLHMYVASAVARKHSSQACEQLNKDLGCVFAEFTSRPMNSIYWMVSSPKAVRRMHHCAAAARICRMSSIA